MLKPAAGRIFLALLFLVSLALRWGHLEERAHWPDFHHPTLDSRYHDRWAWGLASGRWEGRIAEVKGQPYFRAPLYPYFLASLYKIFGRDTYKARWVQGLMGAITALLIFLLTRRLFGKPAALVAWVLYNGYWPVVYFEEELLIPALLLLLVVGGVLAAVIAAGKSKRWVWAVSGLAFGLGAVARPNVFAVYPFILWWIARWDWARCRRTISLWLLAALFPAFVVSARNVAVGKDWVFVAWQGGMNFYIGNNPGSNGVAAHMPGARKDWWGSYDDARIQAEKAEGKDLKPSQVSSYWTRKGLGFLVGEPARACALYLRKLRLMMGNAEPSNNAQLYFLRPRSRVLRNLPVGFGLLFALAAMGVFALFRERPRGGPAIWRLQILPLGIAFWYAVGVLIFFITSRYRLPVAAMTAPYAGLGMKSLVRCLRERRGRAAALYLLVFLSCLGVSLPNPYRVGALADSRGYYDWGVAYGHGDLDEARRCFLASLRADPGYPPAWRMLGWVEARRGNLSRARECLQRACRLDSSDVDGWYNLGVVLHKLGELAEAGKAYRELLRRDPNHVRAMNNLADVLLRSGKPYEAKVLLERCLQKEPGFTNAIYGLGYYYETKGEKERAGEYYRLIKDQPLGQLGFKRLGISAHRFPPLNGSHP